MPEPLIKYPPHLLPEHDERRAIQALEALAFLKSEYAKLRDRMQREIVEWLEANGDLTLGPKRYYAGVAKSWVRKEGVTLESVSEAVLNATAGELEAFASTLSASAFNAGTLRKLLGDGFDELYERKEAPAMKDGKPKKVVKTVQAKEAK